MRTTHPYKHDTNALRSTGPGPTPNVPLLAESPAAAALEIVESTVSDYSLRAEGLYALMVSTEHALSDSGLPFTRQTATPGADHLMLMCGPVAILFNVTDSFHDTARQVSRLSLRQEIGGILVITRFRWRFSLPRAFAGKPIRVIYTDC
jgi:hypothetical protein